MNIITLDKNEKLLRTPSKPIPVDQINTPEFQAFLDELQKSMDNNQLSEGWEPAGIAAVQVGKPIQVFLAINVNSNLYEVFINPEITLYDKATDIKTEGCLSIPEVEGRVVRPKKIQIKYIDRTGKKQKAKLTGWNARIVQHEYDHLQGVLFIDKLLQ